MRLLQFRLQLLFDRSAKHHDREGDLANNNDVILVHGHCPRDVKTKRAERVIQLIAGPGRFHIGNLISVFALDLIHQRRQSFRRPLLAMVMWHFHTKGGHSIILQMKDSKSNPSLAERLIASKPSCDRE